VRAIVKQGGGGYYLNQSHAHPPRTADEATSRWRGFGGHKQAVKDALLDEQYHLCCYSELRADQEGLGYHIEHVENKSQNPQRTFEYGNLAASALASTNDLQVFKAQIHEVFGGHAPGKQHACDMARFVSCHQVDCRRFFAYVSDGRVMPAKDLDAQEQDRAQYTIDTLNLNSPYLLTRRRQWWDELDELFQEHAEKGWSLNDLAAIDLVPVNRRLSRFFSLTRQFFGPTAEQALRQKAPALV
jgi:uncharacterized protein (TIGR02646 family)